MHVKPSNACFRPLCLKRRQEQSHPRPHAANQSIRRPKCVGINGQDDALRCVDWLRQSGVDTDVISGIAKGLDALQVGGDATGRTKAGSLTEMGAATDGMNAATLSATDDTSGKSSMNKDAHPQLHTTKVVAEDAGSIAASAIIAAAGSHFAASTAVRGGSQFIPLANGS